MARDHFGMEEVKRYIADDLLEDVLEACELLDTLIRFELLQYRSVLMARLDDVGGDVRLAVEEEKVTLCEVSVSDIVAELDDELHFPRPHDDRTVAVKPGEGTDRTDRCKLGSERHE